MPKEMKQYRFPLKKGRSIDIKNRFIRCATVTELLDDVLVWLLRVGANWKTATENSMDENLRNIPDQEINTDLSNALDNEMDNILYNAFDGYLEPILTVISHVIQTIIQCFIHWQAEFYVFF